MEYIPCLFTKHFFLFLFLEEKGSNLKAAIQIIQSCASGLTDAFGMQMDF